MATDGELKVNSPVDSLEVLSKEAEMLKTKLEEERQKLNDVACEFPVWSQIPLLSSQL